MQPPHIFSLFPSPIPNLSPVVNSKRHSLISVDQEDNNDLLPLRVEDFTVQTHNVINEVPLAMNSGFMCSTPINDSTPLTIISPQRVVEGL